MTKPTIKKKLHDLHLLLTIVTGRLDELIGTLRDRPAWVSATAIGYSKDGKPVCVSAEQQLPPGAKVTLPLEALAGDAHLSFVAADTDCLIFEVTYCGRPHYFGAGRRWVLIDVDLVPGQVLAVTVGRR